MVVERGSLLAPAEQQHPLGLLHAFLLDQKHVASRTFGVMRVYRPLVLKHLFVQHLDLRCTLFERSVRSAQDVFGFIGCMVVDSFVAVATLSAKNG